MDSKTVEQKRGPDLKEEILDSKEKGDQFRSENQGSDAMNTPNSSNTEISHKK